MLNINFKVAKCSYTLAISACMHMHIAIICTYMYRYICIAIRINMPNTYHDDALAIYSYYLFDRIKFLDVSLIS